MVSGARAEAVWLAPFLVPAAGLGYFATTHGGLVAGGIVAGAGLIVVAYRAPHWVLAPGAFAALAGGDFTGVTSLGQWALVLGGIVVGARLLTEHRGPLAPAAILVIVTWAWISFRISLGSGREFFTPTFACLGAILLSIYVVRRNELTWLTAMLWAAFSYILASQLWGVVDPTGARFEGITGNPNRFAGGMLIALTLMAHGVIYKTAGFPRLFAAGGVVAGTFMLSETGSSQAQVGLVIIGLAVAILLLRKLDRSSVLPIAVAGGSSILGIAWLTDAQLSNDLRTLSGRVDLFSAAIGNFRDNLLFGTGRLEIVDSRAASGRSSHNVFIAVAAGTGLVGLVLWTSVFVSALLAATRAWWIGHVGLWPACALVMVSTVLVQQITFAPLLWVTVALLSGLVANSARKPARRVEGNVP